MKQNFQHQVNRILNQKRIVTDALSIVNENIRDITSVYELTTITRHDKEYFENIIRGCVDKIKNEFKRVAPDRLFKKPDLTITYNEDSKEICMYFKCLIDGDGINFSYNITKIMTINDSGAIIDQSSTESKQFSSYNLDGEKNEQ